MTPLDPVVQAMLVDLFLHVADHCDDPNDRDRLRPEIVEAYRRWMKKPEVQAFYETLVNQRS